MNDDTYGLHLTLRIADVANTDALSSPTRVAEFIKALVHRIGMRILAGPLTGVEGGPPERQGVSAVIILYESHAAIHTYPALGALFLDVFSCRVFDTSAVCTVLTDYFGSHRVVEQTLFDRGVHWNRDVQRMLHTWQASR